MLVTTKYGTIEGIRENGCDIFKGVPYAKPPVGELRFHKPEKPEGWEGIYHADKFRCRSMQGPDRGGFYHREFYSNPYYEVPMSEDCLYLNIWIPENRKDELLPVAVYVHGGAFLGGAGSNLPFVCHELAKSGVIVVTINYRLGVFGFLCHPLLGVSGLNEAGGNYGLWDQLEAITWVKENIENFGGDREKITVFGQSAGAMSLQILAVTEKARGCFQRMILQSGGGYNNPLAEYRSIERASETAQELLEALGIQSKEWKQSEEKRQEALEVLHKASAEELMQAAGKVIATAFEQKKGIPFVPVIDGELLEKDGNQLIREGRYHPISYLLGANANDITTEDQAEVSPAANLLHQGNVAFARMANESGKARAYVYYFTRRLPGDDSGSFHSAELWYVFGSLPYCWRPFTEADYALSRTMISYWCNFMKTGNPNKPGNAVWKPSAKAEAEAEDAGKPDTKLEAEDERKPDTKAEAEDGKKPDTKAEAEDAGKPDTKAEAEDAGKPDTKAEAEDERKPDTKAEAEDAGKPDTKAEAEDERKPDTKAEAEDEWKLCTNAEPYFKVLDIEARDGELYEKEN